MRALRSGLLPVVGALLWTCLLGTAAASILDAVSSDMLCRFIMCASTLLLRARRPLLLFGVSVLLCSTALPGAAAVQLPPSRTESAVSCSACAVVGHSTAVGRTIPTPCRGNLVLPSVHVSPLSGADVGGHSICDAVEELEDWDLASLQTLLDRSVAFSARWAFLSATLLDTLLEHFGGNLSQSTHMAIPADSSTRVPGPLRLTEHLPNAVTFDIASAAFCSRCDIDKVASVTRPHWQLQEAVPADAAIAHTWAPCPVAIACLERLDLYTDGSFGLGTSAWAFAVFGTLQGTQVFVGWAGAPVHPHAWLLQAPKHIPTAIHADCEVALRQATGRYGSATHTGLAVACRHLGPAVQAVHPCFDPNISHVRSHQGQPCNELVDRLAKYVNQCGVAHACESSGLTSLAGLCRSHGLAWLWLAISAMQAPTQWPQYLHSGFLDKDQLADASSLGDDECRALFGLHRDATPTPSPTSFFARLCMFTLNVQSLAETSTVEESPASSGDFKGRAAFLREQLDYYGAHVVALQEARAKTDSTMISQTHVRYCTAKDPQGNFGVELWFSRLKSFATAGGFLGAAFASFSLLYMPRERHTPSMRIGGTGMKLGWLLGRCGSRPSYDRAAMLTEEGIFDSIPGECIPCRSRSVQDPTALVTACVSQQKARDLEDLALSFEDVPTLSELEAAFRSTQLHRAFGVDAIPAEALHAAPGMAARAFFGVVLKSFMRVEEPIQWKGGSLYSVWKGKAAPHLCSSYRGILVSSTVGKAYHKILRQRSVPALTAAATPLQVGGLPRRPVTLAAHVVRAHQSWAASRGYSQATVFLDLREAFYRIMRPLVVGFTGTDTDIANIIRAVQLPPEVMHDLHSHLQQQSLFEQAGASPWQAAVTTEALCCTWFRFERTEHLTETGIGTRPGDNLADIVFSFVFARVLHQVRSTVDAALGVTKVPWHGDMLANPWPVVSAPQEHLPLLDCTWMDDAALVIQSAVADDMPEKLRCTIGALLDGCLGRALLPNLDRGKTEAILALTGRGSRKLRAALFRDAAPHIAAQSELWPSAQVRLVPCYRHLGGLIHHSGSLLRELRHRTALAWSACNRRRKKVFASSFVAVADKRFCLTPLCSLCYFMVQEQCLTTTYFQMACHLLRPHYDVLQARHLGQARVLALAGLPAIPTLLHLARLRHLASCVIDSIPDFWALLHAEGAWLDSVRESLHWLHGLLEPEAPPDSLHAWWLSIRSIIQRAPGTWKRMLRKAQQRATRQEAWASASTFHIGLLVRQLRYAGAILISSLPEGEHSRQCCGPCRKVFRNLQTWSVHAFKTRGRCTVGRGVLAGTQCQKCLRHFSTNLKLCKHLSYSTACRRSLQAAGHFAPVEPGQGSTKGDDPGRFQVPVLQAQGPTLPFLSQQWADEPTRPVAEVIDCLHHVGADVTEDDASTVWEQVRVAFACVCATTSRLRITAEVFAESLAGRRDLQSWLVVLLGQIMIWIQTADLVDWLVPSADPIPEPCQNVGAITLPRPLPRSADSVCVSVGPGLWCKESARRGPLSLTFPFDECLTTLSSGSCLSFLEGPFDDVSFDLCLDSWMGFSQAPGIHLPAKAYHALLSLETLLGDLFRFALRLWGQGVPTRLFCRRSARAHLYPLFELRGTVLSEQTEWDVISNSGGIPEGSLFHLN
ncbi:GIP [Symbiodinium sp. CCMP2592]|nr:GIP [Symbiodinium sp. CCMP2592]